MPLVGGSIACASLSCGCSAATIGSGDEEVSMDEDDDAPASDMFVSCSLSICKAHDLNEEHEDHVKFPR